MHNRWNNALLSSKQWRSHFILLTDWIGNNCILSLSYILFLHFSFRMCPSLIAWRPWELNLMNSLSRCVWMDTFSCLTLSPLSIQICLRLWEQHTSKPYKMSWLTFYHQIMVLGHHWSKSYLIHLSPSPPLTTHPWVPLCHLVTTLALHLPISRPFSEGGNYSQEEIEGFSRKMVGSVCTSQSSFEIVGVRFGSNGMCSCV